jgi:hypothetical protein
MLNKNPARHARISGFLRTSMMIDDRLTCIDLENPATVGTESKLTNGIMPISATADKARPWSPNSVDAPARPTKELKRSPPWKTDEKAGPLILVQGLTKYRTAAKNNMVNKRAASIGRAFISVHCV